SPKISRPSLMMSPRLIPIRNNAGRAGTGIDHAELERLWRPPSAAGPFPNVPRRAAAARQPVRFAADLKPRPLGAARTRRRSQIPDLDGGQPAAPGRLRRSSGGQAGSRGPPRGPIPETRRTRASGFPLKTAPVRLTTAPPPCPTDFLARLHNHARPREPGGVRLHSTFPSVPIAFSPHQRWPASRTDNALPSLF